MLYFSCLASNASEKRGYPSEDKLPPAGRKNHELHQINAAYNARQRSFYIYLHISPRTTVALTLLMLPDQVRPAVESRLTT